MEVLSPKDVLLARPIDQAPNTFVEELSRIVNRQLKENYLSEDQKVALKVSEARTWDTIKQLQVILTKQGWVTIDKDAFYSFGRLYAWSKRAPLYKRAFWRLQCSMSPPLVLFGGMGIVFLIFALRQLLLYGF